MPYRHIKKVRVPFADDIEWQAFALLTEWHRMAFFFLRLPFSSRKTALAIKGEARMPFSLRQKTKFFRFPLSVFRFIYYFCANYIFI